MAPSEGSNIRSFPTGSFDFDSGVVSERNFRFVGRECLKRARTPSRVLTFILESSFDCLWFSISSSCSHLLLRLLDVVVVVLNWVRKIPRLNALARSG